MEFDAPISTETPTKGWAKPIRSCHWVKFKQYRFCQAHAPPGSIEGEGRWGRESPSVNLSIPHH
jgi:hypothetical protein